MDCRQGFGLFHRIPVPSSQMKLPILDGQKSPSNTMPHKSIRSTTCVPHETSHHGRIRF
jgi:hypothetical protein